MEWCVCGGIVSSPCNNTLFSVSLSVCRDGLMGERESMCKCVRPPLQQILLWLLASLM